MAFDGIAIAHLVYEMQEKLIGARITKIAQTESDKLLLTIKNSFSKEDGGTRRTVERLVISVNPSLPLFYLTEDNETSPMQAPTFCMVLRKHLNNCKIAGIHQIGLERVIRFDLEHLNEMGDFCEKRLYIELMGKHSNIIFCDETDTVIDSIKHISALVSSVREVLPGKPYFIPNTMNKSDPLTVTKEEFLSILKAKPQPLDKALYRSFTGISGVVANELLYRTRLSGLSGTGELTEADAFLLYEEFEKMMTAVKEHDFQAHIIYQENVPVEFSSFLLTEYRNAPDYQIKLYESPSKMLYDYYHTKEIYGRIHQKSSDLRRITQTLLERSVKKYDLQLKQLKDTEKREKYKVYGELLTTYGYDIKEGEKKFTCENYYTGEEITIPLDGEKNGVENAKRYFEKYQKLKRTFEALTVQTRETNEEIEHLSSISNALDIATSEEDLGMIRRELSEAGYIKKQTSGKKKKGGNSGKSKPFHYISSDGFHIYVGKNNYQNDELTFKLATGNDWWFHAKKMAGSHVIVKTEGKELPDKTFEEAARLAAYYSKAREQEKAEIDYIQKKHIKKPNGAKPGFVVYYTNYSMTIPTDIEGIREIEE
ncbi:MAG: NFACT family protein [Lachnospiraceae bacterium]|nr:NFACT family protein [Lachnospiraceae bacterium]